MYLRDVHVEGETLALHQLIRENPLGILTTGIKSPTFPFLQSSHVPFVLDIDSGDTAEAGEAGGLGTLRGHLARQNPQSKAMIESVRQLLRPHQDLQLSSGDGIGKCGASSPELPVPGEVPSREPVRPPVELQDEVMVLFTMPVHHYVTPKFYIETKPDSGKVVPTWNYAAAQVYGKARIFFDTTSPDTTNFLSKQVSDLSRHAETSIMGYTGIGSDPAPWAVSDAPDRYIQLLQKAIIGIEIKIERLEGKFKMSQELSEGDRTGVVQGFASMGSEVASRMATMVRERGLDK